MRVTLILAVCAAVAFAILTNFSFAQIGEPSEESAQKGGKSAEACHKCCSDMQKKAGVPARQVGICVSRCMVGTARNC